MNLRCVSTALVLAGSFGSSTGSLHKADVAPRAMEVMRKNAKTMFGLHSFEAVCVMRATTHQVGKSQTGYDVSRLIAVKPNLMRYDAWHNVPSKGPWTTSKLPASPANRICACDGKSNYRQNGNVYVTAGLTELSTTLEPWSGFYFADGSAYAQLQEAWREGELVSGRFLGHRVWHGTSCDVVAFKFKSSLSGDHENLDETYMVGRADHLIHGLLDRTFIVDEGREIERDSVIKNIRLNRRFNQAVFHYKAPKGVTMEAQTTVQPVLPDGQLAPNFTAVSADGAKLKLAGFKGKVVVLDFWATWCGPCKESMPHTQEVVQSLQTSGVPVVALAVDDVEDQPRFQDWVKANQAKYPNLSFLFGGPHNNVITSLFQVSGLPTQFIIDKEGVVRASFVGYGGPTNDLEQAIRSAAK